MKEEYKTILKYGEVEEIINKSRFIGYSKPVDSEEQAIEFIEMIKKKHKDATHNVPAYLLGENDEIQRYSDDGEPSGTAGVPILDMLKKEELKNTAVVVTRYFGGIKLGTGGLVRAYTSTAKLALKASQVVEKILHTLYIVRIDYTLHGKIQNEILNGEYLTKDTIYDDKVNMYIYSRPRDSDVLIEKIKDISSDTADIQKKDSEYLTLLDNRIIEV